MKNGRLTLPIPYTNSFLDKKRWKNVHLAPFHENDSISTIKYDKEKYLIFITKDKKKSVFLLFLFQVLNNNKKSIKSIRY